MTTSATAGRLDGNLRAIIAMVAAMLVFAASDVLLKIVGGRMPLGQMLLLRAGIASALIIGLAWWTGALAAWRLVLIPQVFWRTFAEAVCSVLYFAALLRMTLADAAAISNSAPLIVMAGAALLLGEGIGWRRWTAAGVGFLGVMLIVKPGTGAFQPAALIMLASSLFVAMRDLITRRLPPGVPTILIAASAMLGVMATGAVMAVFESWHRPSPAEWSMLVASSLAVIAGFMLTIEAMRGGDIGVVQPFRYSFMLFAAAASLIVFRERPDLWSWLGIALILGAGLYTIHRERVRRSEARR